MHNCLNCGTHFNGKFCPSCGQKAHVSRLTGKALLHEIVHFFTHVEENFFRTTWLFISHPGQISLDYVNGKRKPYQQPVSYFMIWTGVYILVHNFLLNYFHFPLVLMPGGQSLSASAANILLREHFAWFMLPLAFISAFLIWFVLARDRLFYFEIFTLVLYGGGTYFAMTLFSDLVLGVVLRMNINHYSVFLWQTLLSALYNLWFTVDLFRRMKIKRLWIRIILTSLLNGMAGYLVMVFLPEFWLYLSG